MVQYSIFLLPLLALALGVFFPISFDVAKSKSWKSRRRRRILLTRFAIVVLLFATLVALAWPVQSLNFLPSEGLNRLAQGVLLSAALLAPACIAHWFFTMKYGSQSRSRRVKPAEESADDPSPEADQPAASVDTSPVVKNTETAAMDASAVVQNTETASVDASAVVQNTETASVDASSGVQSTETASVDTSPVAQSAETASVDTSPVAQNAEAVSVDASPVAQNTESASVDASPVHQNADTANVDASQVAQNTETANVDASQVAQHTETANVDASQAAQHTETANVDSSTVARNSETAIGTAGTPISQDRPSQSPQAQAQASMMSGQTIDDDRADSPLEVQEQLERMSELVGSHDLGDSDAASTDNDTDHNRHGIRESHDRHVANTHAMVTATASPYELAKLSTGEIAQLVTSLRKDKGRLQRLVIAQQASLDSERQAHDRSRIMTRDAIKIMRDSRNAQKHAEKLARRERTERQRIEQEYKKVKHVLQNAMSIIKTRKSEQAAAANSEKPATAAG